MTIPRLIKIYFWVVAAILLPLSLFAQNKQPGKEYTKEHPLVYEDAWNLWPYCYLNEHGEPEGYNIDLVKMIFEELDIPYVIKLKSTRTALQDLKEGRSDLMLGLDNRYENAHLFCSNSVVQLFTHSVVYPKAQPTHIKTIADLGSQQAIVHKGSFCHHLMESKGWAGNAIAKNDMKAAIKTLSAEGKGQIVWNTMSLKWLLRKFQIENLQMESVDMPHGAYKFMSGDSVLISQMDEAFRKLSMDYHNFEDLQNRWFYPEQVDSGIPSWVWYVTGGVFCTVLVLLLLNIFYHYRERKSRELITRSTQQLAHILNLSHMNIWTFDISTRIFNCMDPEEQRERAFSVLEFSKRFSYTDFELLCDGMRRVAGNEQEQVTLELETLPNNEKGGNEKRIYSIALSVLRRENGKPTVLLGTMSDVTEERKRQRETSMLLMRYKSIFENAMVDMFFYNSDGFIVNMNKRAMSTFGMDMQQARQLQINLKDIIGDDTIDLNGQSEYHVTRSMNVYNQFLPDEQPKEQNIYYEFKLLPVFDKEHNLLGTYGTGREVTDVVNNWRQQKKNIRKLHQANQEVESYIRNIDYVLEKGGVRIANYSPQNHTLTIFRETNVVQHTLTQSRCMTLVADESKKKSLRMLTQLDNLTAQPVNAVVKTNLRINGQQQYLQMNFVPTYDADGTIKNYFGLCRDVTAIKTTELQLAKETQRAKEVEELKNSFLRNMSYEIRTPLNAVVGFAELFEMDHQQADEDIFIKEIKNNAAYLLRLINDILFLSRLDAHMIEIKKQPTDFAGTIESYCISGWANDQKEGVHYSVVNHFEQLVVDIDDANLGLVISQITANAAQHTKTGTVRVRYDYFDGKLIIIVEDTGSGIPEEQMKHIFERFNSGNNAGTGLGLPICQELTRQMGGNINITSRVGVGTTVWIVIPCQVTAMERKIEKTTTA